MLRFKKHELEGRQCVLLYCGDFDPDGHRISETLRNNLAELRDAVGWDPSELIIDRFGLNYDFIEANGLSWIDGLKTGRGEYPLDDPRHKNHKHAYVQNYLKQYGARKVESNAWVAAPEAGRRLCLEAITRYVSEDAVQLYKDALELRVVQIKEVMRDMLSSDAV